MRQKSQTRQTGAAKAIKDVRRATRKQYSAEEKIRIVLDGLRGEDSIAELCRIEGIAQSIYYKWSKEFLEAGKRRLAGDTARAASTGEVTALIAVTTGLRRGEVLALRWEHLDLDGGVLRVMESLEETGKGLRFKEPKNKRRRQVDIPAFLSDAIKKHRIDQAQALLKVGIRLTGETLVCCRCNGEPMSPENLSRQFPVAVERAGLPRITFHGLRHSHATLLLGAGVHMKVASERLGHSGIGITMDLYSHVLLGDQQEASAKVDKTFKAAVNSRFQST